MITSYWFTTQRNLRHCIIIYSIVQARGHSWITQKVQTSNFTRSWWNGSCSNSHYLALHRPSGNGLIRFPSAGARPRQQISRLFFSGSLSRNGVLFHFSTLFHFNLHIKLYHLIFNLYCIFFSFCFHCFLSLVLRIFKVGSSDSFSRNRASAGFDFKSIFFMASSFKVLVNEKWQFKGESGRNE